MWQLPPLGIFASRTATDTAFWTADSEWWCRRTSPERGSVETFDAGNTYCHPQLRSALGYFRARASGRYTQPKPRARSFS